MRFTAAALLLALAAPALAADVGDATQRKFIEEGMTESEVVLKIGPPDYESVDSGPHAKVLVKRWTYYPDPKDAQTITILTLRGGIVSFVERTISR